jgi:hypothetical protein
VEASVTLAIWIALALGCSSRDGARDADLPDADPRCECEGQTAVCGSSREACASGRCVEGRGCVACRSGERVCRGRDVRACGDDGMPGALLEPCTGTDVCESGECVESCDGPPSSLGCSFVAVTTLSSRLGAAIVGDGYTALGVEGYEFGIALSNPHDFEVGVRVTGPSTEIERTIAARSTTVVVVPWVAALTGAVVGGVSGSAEDDETPYRGTSSALVRDGAYRIVSDAPIAAYQFNPYNVFYEGEHVRCGDRTDALCANRTSGASLLLPEASFGREYTIVSHDSRYAAWSDCPDNPTPGDAPSAFLTIVCGPAPTEVRVVPSSMVRGGAELPLTIAAAETLAVRLEPGDVLQLVANPPMNADDCLPAEVVPDCSAACLMRGDLTATTVQSDEPVAVFVGHDCARAPNELVPPNLSGCDHLEEQLWPNEVLGQRYVAMRLVLPRDTFAPTMLRIVGTREGTHVTLSPPLSGRTELDLGPGIFEELELFAGVEIDANAPIAVAVVTPSFGLYQKMTSQLSDPSLTFAVPISQWQREYTFFAAETFAESYAAIAAPNGAEVTLDGERLEPFETIGNYDYYYAALAGGQHRLAGTEPFTAQISGHAISSSYAYPAGGRLEPFVLD